MEDGKNAAESWPDRYTMGRCVTSRAPKHRAIDDASAQLVLRLFQLCHVRGRLRSTLVGSATINPGDVHSIPGPRSGSRQMRY